MVVGRELRKMVQAKEKMLERLRADIETVESEDRRSKILLEIEELNEWIQRADEYRQGQKRKRSERKKDRKEQSKTSGLDSLRARELSGGGGPGTGKRR